MMGRMNKTRAVSLVADELATFRADEQEKLGRQFASYLRKVRTLRQAFGAGEADIEQGKVRTLDNLDAAIEELRRQHVG